MSRLILPNLPNIWIPIAIGKLASIVYGEGLRVEERANMGGIPVYGSGGLVGEHNKALHDGPSIVIGRKGNVGSIHYTPGPFWCIDTAFYLDNITTFVDIEYLAHVLQFIDLSRLVIAVGVPGINRQDIAKQEIPLPPLPEQQRIVALLRHASVLCYQRREADELAQDLLPALYDEMFGDPATNPRGWPKKTVKRICNLVRGSSPRPQGDSRYFGGPVPRLMVADVTRDGIYVTPTTDSLTEEGAKQSRPMKAGSVVMVVSGAPGLPAILRVDACIHDGFVGFQDLSKDVAPEYLVSTLTSLKARNASQAEGAIFRNLKTDQINNWKIPVPPPELQRSFVTRMKAILEITQQYTATTKQFEDLFRSLLARAFAGELTEAWRDQHRAELREAAELRNQWVKGQGHRTTEGLTGLVIQQPELAKHQRFSVLRELQNSPEQWRVYEVVAQTTTPISVQNIAEDSNLPVAAIRRHLALLHALGIVGRANYQLNTSEQLHYAPLYRLLTEADNARTADLAQLRQVFPATVGLDSL